MEWQNEMDINLYDFGARNYDPALGRWMNVDPLAEKYPSISPYTYAYNNPVYYIDPDRMMSWGHYGSGNSGGGFTLTTLSTTGEVLDVQTVSSLEGTGLEVGWNEGADGRDLGGNGSGGGLGGNLAGAGMTPGGGEKINGGGCHPGGDCGNTPPTSSEYTFNEGKSPFKLKEINYIGGGEAVTAGYGTLEIVATNNAPEGLRGQTVSSNGITVGAGIGAPIEIFSGAVGTIYFHQAVSGNNLQEIFSSTNFVTIKSISAVLKYTSISGYDNANMNNLIWSANLYGGGVLTAGLHGSRSTVRFTNKN